MESFEEASEEAEQERPKKKGGVKRKGSNKARKGDKKKGKADEAEDDAEEAAQVEVPARRPRGIGRGKPKSKGKGKEDPSSVRVAASPFDTKVTPTANSHRRYKLVKKLKLMRQTSAASGSQAYNVRPRAMLANMATIARAELADMQEKGQIDKYSNVVRIGAIVGYAVGGGAPTVWEGKIDKTWTSGFARAEEPKEKEKNMNAWLAKVAADKVLVRELARHDVTIGDSASGAKSAQFAHSEVDCASDPETDGLLDKAVADFLAQIKGDKSTLVVRDAMIAAHSEPNAMCKGACSFALDQVGRRFAAKVNAAVLAVGGRLSATEATATIVTATKQFGPQLKKEFHDRLVPAVTNDGTPAQAGGHLLIEQVAKKQSLTHPTTGTRPKLVGVPCDYDSADSDEDAGMAKEEDEEEEAEDGGVGGKGGATAGLDEEGDEEQPADEEAEREEQAHDPLSLVLPPGKVRGKKATS